MALPAPSSELLNDLRRAVARVNRSYSWRQDGGYLSHPYGISHIVSEVMDLAWWLDERQYVRRSVWDTIKLLEVQYPSLGLMEAIKQMYDRALKDIPSRSVEKPLPVTHSQFYGKIENLMSNNEVSPVIREYVIAVEGRLQELSDAIDVSNWTSLAKERYSNLVDFAICLECLEINQRMHPYLWRVLGGRKDKRKLALTEQELWEVIRKRGQMLYTRQWRDKRNKMKLAKENELPAINSPWRGKR